jgi:histidinol-phosphate/aromatic aminotransferase/cobyric acid decarboxylase-like protein
VDDGDQVIIHVPTYAFFETQARINGGQPVLVPLKDDFTFDPGDCGRGHARTQGDLPVLPEQPNRQQLDGR